MFLFTGLLSSAGKVLIKCQDYFLAHPEEEPQAGHTYKVTNGTLETYEDIAEVAFGTRGRELVSMILYTELLGTCALFLILQKGMLCALCKCMHILHALLDSHMCIVTWTSRSSVFLPWYGQLHDTACLSRGRTH